MIINTYDIGDRVRTAVLFADTAGLPADPTTVKFFLKKPDGTEEEYTYGVGGELVKVSTGSYRVDLTVTLEGYYTFRFEGTGALVSAAETRFGVRQSAF